MKLLRIGLLTLCLLCLPAANSFCAKLIMCSKDDARNMSLILIEVELHDLLSSLERDTKVQRPPDDAILWTDDALAARFQCLRFWIMSLRYGSNLEYVNFDDKYIAQLDDYFRRLGAFLDAHNPPGCLLYEKSVTKFRSIMNEWRKMKTPNR